jgi:hypothetical protein
VRANVPGSGSGCGGAHFVWGGPCVDRAHHTKWASQVRPFLGLQGDLEILRVCWQLVSARILGGNREPIRCARILGGNGESIRPISKLAILFSLAH